MSSMNLAVLIGYIGADPESRSTATGKQVVTVSIATNSSVNTDGVWSEVTYWHRLTAWGKEADFLRSYAKKGGLLAVECVIEPKKWTDAKGVTHYVTDLRVKKVCHLGKPPAKTSFRPGGHVEEPMPDLPDYEPEDDRNPPPPGDSDYHEPLVEE